MSLSQNETERLIRALTRIGDMLECLVAVIERATPEQVAFKQPEGKQP